MTLHFATMKKKTLFQTQGQVQIIVNKISANIFIMILNNYIFNQIYCHYCVQVPELGQHNIL